MHVTVDVAGGDTQEVDLQDPTYGDLVREAGFSPQEATVLVDGRPVPEDDPVPDDRAEVTVLRLIRGG